MNILQFPDWEKYDRFKQWLNVHKHSLSLETNEPIHKEQKLHYFMWYYTENKNIVALQKWAFSQYKSTISW